MNSFWTMPWLSKRQISMFFYFWFPHSWFLQTRWVARVSLRTLSFLVRIVFENPRFITCYDMFEIFLSFSMCSRRSRHTFLRFSFCSLVRILGTSLAQIFWMPNSKIKISCEVWRFKFNTLLIILLNVDQTTRSLTLVTFSSVYAVQVSTERETSIRPRDPSLWSYFRPFMPCKFRRNEVRLAHCQGHP